MGIGMLDSEESSSSVASAIALTVGTASASDENSNEATPNLDAPKFYQRVNYRVASETTLNGTLVAADNNNVPFDVYRDEPSYTQSQTQQQHPKLSAEKLPHHKKVSFLSAGVGLIKSNSNSPNGSASSRTRSPLATVICNNQVRNSNVQQQLQQQVSNAHDNSTQLSLLPSTSKQALLLKQKSQQQSHRLMPNDDFFLYRTQMMRTHIVDGKNHFNKLSDEMILHIFKWLPKKTLLRLGVVCRRFNCCASDESLWTRLDLGGRSLRSGALENILTRGVVILRLAQAEMHEPAFSESFLQMTFESKLQYLDLSLVSITKPSLKALLSHCRQLKKLSIEHVQINDEICIEIAQNTNLEALNLAMCTGLEAWSVRKLLESLPNLNSLNISWTYLSVDAVTSLVTHLTPNILRLNVAGCRKTMFDTHLTSLAKRCPQLLELDLSDCSGLTSNAISIICKFKMLEYLSLSRCYLIPASSYVELKNLPTLTYLDVFGMLSETVMELLEKTFPNIGINKFIHSSVARPTVGTRRTSIWGLRTRD